LWIVTDGRRGVELSDRVGTRAVEKMQTTGGGITMGRQLNPGR